MNTLFIDIETISCQREDLANELTLNIPPAPATSHGKRLDEDGKQEWKATKMNEVVAKTALDGTFGEIVCIGYALDDGPVETIHKQKGPQGPGASEPHLLTEFMDRLYSDTNFRTHPLWIGHNVTFDVRFLWQRFVIHKLPMPVAIPYNAKPWSPGIFDTLWHWSGMEYKNHGLEMLCKVFDLPPKPFKSNSVAQLWVEDRIDDIAALCAHDVEMVRKLYHLMIRTPRNTQND